MNRWIRFSLFLPLAACSSTATSTDGGSDAAADVAVDACCAFDAPSTDVPFVADDSPPDVVQVTDAGSIIGRWRMVGLTTTGAAALTVTDTNAPIGGTAVQGRCNGLMIIEASRFTIAYGLLTNDHFYADANAPMYANAIAAAGASAPGTLTGNTFSIPGTATTFTWLPNSDGTISSTDATTGNITTWARADTLPPAATGLLGQGYAIRYMSATSSPLMHPRAAVVWDNAGGSTVTLSNDSPLTFGPMGYASFPATINSIPPAAVGNIGGTQVSVAYVIVYDDTDSSGSFTPPVGDAGAGDVLRGFAPVGIAYRSEGAPSAAFMLSPLRDLLSGYQYINVHIDYSSSTAGVSPFDPTHPAAIDVAIDTGPVALRIPDLIP